MLQFAQPHPPGLAIFALLLSLTYLHASPPTSSPAESFPIWVQSLLLQRCSTLAFEARDLLACSECVKCMLVVRRIQSRADAATAIVHPLLHMQALRWIYFPDTRSSSNSGAVSRGLESASAAAAALQGDHSSALAALLLAHNKEWLHLHAQGVSAALALDQGMQSTRIRLPPPAACGAGGWGDEKFVVFRFWAGLCNRRIELQNMVAVAKLLNRTLVLPPVTPGRDVGDIYDLNALKTFIRVISWVEFQSMRCSPPPGHLHVHDHGYPGHLGVWRVMWFTVSSTPPTQKQQPQSSSTISAALASIQSTVLAIDWCYRFIDLGIFREFSHFDGQKDWMPPVPHGIPVSFRPNQLGQSTLRSLPPSPALAAAAAAAAKTMGLANGRGHGYVALHVRRNDMWHWRERTHAWPLLEELQAQAVQFMPPAAAAAAAAAADGDDNSASAGYPLFLMTDANSTEIDSLTRGLNSLGYRVVFGGQTADVMIDVLVAAGARKFLGNVWSTVSWAVVEEMWRRCGDCIERDVRWQTALRWSQRAS